MTSNSFFKYIVIVKTCSDIFYTIGQKKEPFCMLSVYLYLHFRQSLISVAVCISKYRH